MWLRCALEEECQRLSDTEMRERPKRHLSVCGCPGKSTRVFRVSIGFTVSYSCTRVPFCPYRFSESSSSWAISEPLGARSPLLAAAARRERGVVGILQYSSQLCIRLYRVPWYNSYGSLLAQESLRPLFPPFSKSSVHLEPHPPPADMTSDYVDAVLFQLHWEAFEDLDARARRLLYHGMGCYSCTTRPSASRLTTNLTTQ